MHITVLFFFLMIRRPPRSTLDRSSAASDVYKRQGLILTDEEDAAFIPEAFGQWLPALNPPKLRYPHAVSYTHLRAHETVLDLVCRLLLEKKNTIPLHNTILV